MRYRFKDHPSRRQDELWGSPSGPPPYQRSAAQVGNQDPVERPFEDIVEEVYQDNPRLRQHGFNVRDRRDAEERPRGYAEFYSPNEPPEYREGHPEGAPGIDIFEVPEGGDLKELIYGEMLHHLPDADPTFNQAREDFRNARSDEQRALDEEAYQYAVNNLEEERDFEDWFEYSRLDGWIRARLSPSNSPDWSEMPYTDRQEDILGTMKRHLSSKYPGRTPRLP